MPKYVTSTTLEDADWNNSTIIRENAIEEITRLKQGSGDSIGIIGSPKLVRSMMEASLIDEFYFMVFSIVLGNRFRLFRENQTSSLRLVETRAFQLGAALLPYQRQ